MVQVSVGKGSAHGQDNSQLPRGWRTSRREPRAGGSAGACRRSRVGAGVQHRPSRAVGERQRHLRDLARVADAHADAARATHPHTHTTCATHPHTDATHAGATPALAQSWWRAAGHRFRWVHVGARRTGCDPVGRRWDRGPSQAAGLTCCRRRLVTPAAGGRSAAGVCQRPAGIRSRGVPVGGRGDCRDRRANTARPARSSRPAMAAPTVQADVIREMTLPRSPT